jgi:hypothetical protein
MAVAVGLDVDVDVDGGQRVGLHSWDATQHYRPRIVPGSIARRGTGVRDSPM